MSEELTSAVSAALKKSRQSAQVFVASYRTLERLREARRSGEDVASELRAAEAQTLDAATTHRDGLVLVRDEGLKAGRDVDALYPGGLAHGIEFVDSVIAGLRTLLEVAECIEELQTECQDRLAALEEVGQLAAAASAVSVGGVTVQCDSNSFVTNIHIRPDAFIATESNELGELVLGAAQASYDRWTQVREGRLGHYGDRPPDLAEPGAAASCRSGAITAMVDRGGRPSQFFLHPSALPEGLEKFQVAATACCRLAALRAVALGLPLATGIAAVDEMVDGFREEMAVLEGTLSEV